MATMLTRRQHLVQATAALASLAATTTPTLPQELPLIRFGYLLPPISEMAGIFTVKPELLTHRGKTYNFEAKYVRGSPLLVTAFAAGEIDVGNLGVSTFHQAVVNAGLSDMKIIGDEAEDGFHGMFSSQVRVRKDSGINKITDLKGKVIATIALGSGADMLTRYTLRKQGLELNRDWRTNNGDQSWSSVSGPTGFVRTPARPRPMTRT